MCPLRYYPMLCRSNDPIYLRFELVCFAREQGIKPAAREFGTTVKTVRKWLRRWEPSSLRGLADHNCAPHHSPRVSPRGSASRPCGSSSGSTSYCGARGEVNHKRIYRLYKLEGLSLRLKTPKKCLSRQRVVRASDLRAERVMGHGLRGWQACRWP